jgi:hypothetical protein
MRPGGWKAANNRPPAKADLRGAPGGVQVNRPAQALAQSFSSVRAIGACFGCGWRELSSPILAGTKTAELRPDAIDSVTPIAGGAGCFFDPRSLAETLAAGEKRSVEKAIKPPGGHHWMPKASDEKPGDG